MVRWLRKLAIWLALILAGLCLAFLMLRSRYRDAAAEAEAASIDRYTFWQLPRLENGLVLLLHIAKHLDGGLGLIKVSFMRFLHINLMKNIRTPIHDHMRKNK